MTKNKRSSTEKATEQGPASEAATKDGEAVGREGEVDEAAGREGRADSTSPPKQQQLLDRLETQGQELGTLRARIQTLEIVLKAERKSRRELSKRLEAERDARARAEDELAVLSERGLRVDDETLERLRVELDRAWKRARAAEAELGRFARWRLRRRLPTSDP